MSEAGDDTSCGETADDLFRRYSLILAARRGEAVEIEGIIIDLCFELEPRQWQPVNPLGLYGHPAALDGPEIVFPWTGADWRDGFERQGGYVAVGPGDRISVRSVTTAPLQTVFDDLDTPAERERKLAFLQVTKASGEVVLVRKPLLLLQTAAVANLIGIGDHLGAYRGMLTRLEEVFGVDDIEELLEKPPQAWPAIREGASRSYGLALLALSERDGDHDGHASAAFGYMMARAEAEEQLLAQARRGANLVKHAQAASEAKVAIDRAASEPIRQRAAEHIRQRPDISLTRCAKLVADEFQRDHRWVSRTIKPLFEPRGNGEYRGRRSSAT